MEICSDNNKLFFKLSEDYKKSLEERDIVKDVLSSDAEVLNLIAFKLNLFGSENILQRVDTIGEEPYRIMYILNNLEFIIKDTSSIKFEETNSYMILHNDSAESQVNYTLVNGYRLVNIDLVFAKNYITLDDINKELKKWGVGFREENFLSHKKYNKEQILIHSLSNMTRLRLILCLINNQTNIDKVLFELRTHLKNYYTVPIFRHLQINTNFEDGVKLIPDRFIANFKEISEKIISKTS